MAITRLKRKGRKNKLKSVQRNQKLKLESFKPVIKQIDVEAIKAEFKSSPSKVEKVASKTEETEVDSASEVKGKAPAKKKAAPKAETEAKEKEVKKKAPAKKAAAKTTKAKKEE